jgi:RNA polymerase sigma factor (sigma-70 family)
MASRRDLDPAEQVRLMTRIAEQEDRAAFAALFAYYAPRIKAYMMRSGSDDVSGEEFAQEAMLMVWRKAARFDAAQASVATWIFTIARNKRIDAYRRNNRPELEPDDPLLAPEPEQMQDDSVLERQTAETIRAAMADLPEEQARMLKLAFYEDKAHSEIAEETGLPLGTVKSRLRLAMGKLRGKLGDTEI